MCARARVYAFVYLCFVVLSGVGGNLVAIQASRLSTSLHQQFGVGDSGAVPENPQCCGTFRGSGECLHFHLIALVCIVHVGVQLH